MTDEIALSPRVGIIADDLTSAADGASPFVATKAGGFGDSNTLRNAALRFLAPALLDVGQSV